MPEASFSSCSSLHIYNGKDHFSVALLSILSVILLQQYGLRDKILSLFRYSLEHFTYVPRCKFGITTYVAKDLHKPKA